MPTVFCAANRVGAILANRGIHSALAAWSSSPSCRRICADFLGVVSVEQGQRLFGLYGWNAKARVGVHLSYDPPAIAVSPSGKRVAVVNPGDDAIRFLSASGEVFDPSIHVRDARKIRHLRFSGDGSRLAVVDGSDEPPAVRVFDAKKGAELQNEQLVFPVLRGGIVDIAFSPDKTRVVAIAQNNAVYTWSAGGATEKLEPAAHRRDKRTPNRMQALAMSKDGAVFATGCEDGTVQIWDTATGAPVGEPVSLPLEKPTSCALELEFRDDGSLL